MGLTGLPGPIGAPGIQGTKGEPGDIGEPVCFKMLFKYKSRIYVTIRTFIFDREPVVCEVRQELLEEMVAEDVRVEMEKGVQWVLKVPRVK